MFQQLKKEMQVAGRLRSAAMFFVLACLVFYPGSSVVNAQPAGWSGLGSVIVTENSGAAQTDIPVLIVLDTASMIAAGDLRSDAGDLRFGSDPAGTTLYSYWIESGINTASTNVWVNVPSIPGGGTVTVYVYYNNPAATSASSPSVFGSLQSATDQVVVTSVNNPADTQRGFRFRPNVPVLVTSFGKRVPNATARYVTLFDFSTQAIVHQEQVPAGTAGVYNYIDVPQPFWLDAGSDYVLEVFQATGDSYYYGSSSQINSSLTYVEMRYANSATQNTFPTNTLSNYHYGTPDFEFYARKTVTPSPTVKLGTTTSITLHTPDPSTAGQAVTVSYSVTADLPGNGTPTGSVIVTDGVDSCNGTVATGGCTLTLTTAGLRTLTATYGGDANFAASFGTAAQSVGTVAVPAMDGWGMAIFVMLAGLVSARYRRRRKA